MIRRAGSRWQGRPRFFKQNEQNVKPTPAGQFASSRLFICQRGRNVLLLVWFLGVMGNTLAPPMNPQAAGLLRFMPPHRSRGSQRAERVVPTDATRPYLRPPRLSWHQPMLSPAPGGKSFLVVLRPSCWVGTLQPLIREQFH
jgi:hypothetical protein